MLPSGLLKCFPQFWTASYSNEQLPMFLFRLVHKEVPISWRILRFRFEECFLQMFVSKNVIPLSFFNKKQLFRIVHCIRLYFERHHMSLLDASLLHLWRRKFTFATDLSISNSELVGFWSGTLRCNSSTWRMYPWHITTQNVKSFVVMDGIWMKNPLMPRCCLIRTSRSGPIIVCPRIAA